MSENRNTSPGLVASGDIVERIRSLRYVHVPVASQLMAEAAAEIKRLRLTDEERAAVETAMDGYIAWMEDNVALETPRVQAKLATLRSLLARLAVK